MCLTASDRLYRDTCNNCNMGTRALPEMYARQPEGVHRPRAEGIHSGKPKCLCYN